METCAAGCKPAGIPVCRNKAQNRGQFPALLQSGTEDRPLRVSDNKNIKISLKAQAHFSGLNDCKHTGKYKILYAFSAFVQ